MFYTHAIAAIIWSVETALKSTDRKCLKHLVCLRTVILLLHELLIKNKNTFYFKYQTVTLKINANNIESNRWICIDLFRSFTIKNEREIITIACHPFKNPVACLSTLYIHNEDKGESRKQAQTYCHYFKYTNYSYVVLSKENIVIFYDNFAFSEVRTVLKSKLEGCD